MEMAITGIDHRAPSGGTGSNHRITGAETETKTRSLLALLDGASSTAAGANDEAADDAMTGPRNVAFQMYVIYRCNRWGTYERWLENTGMRESKPKATRSWWGPIVLDGNVTQDWRDPRDICPVDIVEALETRAAVYGLPQLLREVMVQEHVRYGTQQQKADALKIGRTTFWRYRELAYGRLLDRMNIIGAGLEADDETEDPI